jgi:hypothetical protein
LLSPIVLSVVQVFHLYDVKYGLCLCERVVVFKVGSVETVEIRQVMWLVMLESAKHRILGVDTLEQHVPPCVRFRMAFLVIRGVVGSVPWSDEWEATW